MIYRAIQSPGFRHRLYFSVSSSYIQYASGLKPLASTYMHLGSVTT